MKFHIWTPNTNSELDDKFHNLRQNQFSSGHNLRLNYSKKDFDECLKLTMVEDSSGKMLACASILQRDIWPNGVYRILNRLWKPHNKIFIVKDIAEAIVVLMTNQIDWLKTNTDVKLYFISRQKLNWTTWAIEKSKKAGFMFSTDVRFFQTCKFATSDKCWQQIIYNGDQSLLDSWPSKILN
jgi:hypothetical protein